MSGAARTHGQTAHLLLPPVLRIVHRPAKEKAEFPGLLGDFAAMVIFLTLLKRHRTLN